MPLWAHLLLIAVGGGVLLVFALVGQWHFASAKRPPFTTAVYVASAIGFAAFAAGVLRIGPSISIAVALGLQAISLIVFASAINATRNQGLTSVGDRDLPAVLVARGPYRWVRHPFYLSYIIFWAACAIMVLSTASTVAFVVITALYVRAALTEEAKFGRSQLDDTYRQYQRNAGFLWPRI